MVIIHIRKVLPPLLLASNPLTSHSTKNKNSHQFELHKQKIILTQLTTGGSSEAEIATPISGPADPWSNATATPLPDVSAQRIPIHSDRAFPLDQLKEKKKKSKMN